MKITATRIHDGLHWLPSGSTVVANDEGTIVGLLAEPDNETIHYDGIICPGFVNAHCHLELSHMRGLIPEKTGLIGFLEQVMQYRGLQNETERSNARHAAAKELMANGVVAIGDIANTVDTIDLRQSNSLTYHTFVEAIGFNPAGAPKAWANASSILAAFSAAAGGGSHTQSITAHAPYSVSKALFQQIDSSDAISPISIHNQESQAENEYYRDKSGAVNHLFATLGINDDHFLPSGVTSLQTYGDWLHTERNTILVHNTYSNSADIAYAQSRFKNLYWCLCPNANLYIESTLPDITLLMGKNANICIGTDSLASNRHLNILGELQTINRAYPTVGWENLLHWATYGGAKALGFGERFGRLQIGTQPGIIHLTNMEASPIGIERIV
jgi:aminodeoxyfutalosine deaminase